MKKFRLYENKSEGYYLAVDVNSGERFVYQKVVGDEAASLGLKAFPTRESVEDALKGSEYEWRN